MTSTSSLDQLAARQHSLATTRQLSQLGLGPKQIWRTRTSGLLIPMRRNVYRVAGAPQTWEQAVLAAALAAGDDAVVSHTTAAAVWDLKYSNRATAGLHVTTNHQLRIAGITGHQNRLTRGQRLTFRGIPVTSPERTLLDVADTMTPARLGECLDDALRRQLIRLDRLRRLVSDVSPAGRHPLAPVQKLLADRTEDFRAGDSDWEQEMDRQWDRLGLPPARKQYRVNAGGHTYKLDRAIPELKVGAEWNGFDTHGGRASFDYDSDRLADLAAEGWHVAAFTSNSSPERIARAVLRIAQDRQVHIGKPDPTVR